jgi:hypothetical protein
MSSEPLENLVGIGQLHREAPRDDELEGLAESGRSRLKDAERTELAFDSRFDLAYNAAHALALYALRRRGYRPASRFIVFQALEHTADVSTGYRRVLVRAHDVRNAAEYEGYLNEDEQLLADVIAAARALAGALFGKGGC